MRYFKYVQVIACVLSLSAAYASDDMDAFLNLVLEGEAASPAQHVTFTRTVPQPLPNCLSEINESVWRDIFGGSAEGSACETSNEHTQLQSAPSRETLYELNDFENLLDSLLP